MIYLLITEKCSCAFEKLTWLYYFTWSVQLLSALQLYLFSPQLQVTETKSCATAQAFMLCNWWDKYLSKDEYFIWIILNVYIVCLYVVYLNISKIYIMVVFDRWKVEKSQ